MTEEERTEAQSVARLMQNMVNHYRVIYEKMNQQPENVRPWYKIGWLEGMLNDMLRETETWAKRVAEL